jgi:hypothetical protein
MGKLTEGAYIMKDEIPYQNHANVIIMENGNYLVRINRKTITTSKILPEAKLYMFEETDKVLTELQSYGYKATVATIYLDNYEIQNEFIFR